MKKVNILGTEYSFIHDDSVIEQGHDGECREYSKEIRIRKLTSMLCGDDTLEDKKKRYDEVARHEITHAFFAEAGLDDYCEDEVLVQWIAKQFPKMLDVMRNLDCI